jgi:muconolactone delta-isomerase
MYFFATGHVTSPDKIGPFLEEEKRVLSELRQQGLVREAFTPVGGHGVISFLEASSLQEAREQMSRLPFVAHGLMTFDYTEVAEL